jgi:hypothetical protein
MYKRKWHDDMIVRHIMARHGTEPLNSYYYATTYPDVYAAAERLFGSWKDAIEYCGLDYSTIRKYQEWSRQRVLDEIRKAHKEDTPISSKYTQDYNKPLYMAAIKRFKSWEKALKAAGIDYDDVRLRRKMSRAQIKREILELYSQNVDLAYPYMRENHQYLLAAGMKKLGNGSWALARKKCGIRINYRLPKHKRNDSVSNAKKKGRVAYI